MFKVVKRIRECRIALLEWNRTTKSNSRAKILELKDKLRAAREEGELGNRVAITGLKLMLSKAYKEEKLYWS